MGPVMLTKIYLYPNSQFVLKAIMFIILFKCLNYHVHQSVIVFKLTVYEMWDRVFQPCFPQISLCVEETEVGETQVVSQASETSTL